MSKLAAAYGMKRRKMAEGGMSDEPAAPGEKKESMEIGGSIVDKAYKKYSEGGMVSNGGEDELSDLADSKPNNFDDLALDDGLESDNTGASAGDFLGNEEEDSDREDIVARAMRQRNMKKNHNPRPA